MGAVLGPSKLDMIPWDYNSKDHVERAYLQRVACGWRSEEVPEWVEKTPKGAMNVYWLVLSDSIPDRNGLIAKHIAKYPKETHPLTDTSQMTWLNHARTPTNNPISPIGHVALMLPPAEELQDLDLPSSGVVYIGNLYVSYALQGQGLGGAAMRAVEAIARDQLGADMCFLSTIDSKYQMREDVLDRFYTRHGNPVPKISNESWYAKMGYNIFKTEEKGYWHTDLGTGEHEWLPVKYFKKMLR